jgi:hypothetical protein
MRRIRNAKVGNRDLLHAPPRAGHFGLPQPHACEAVKTCRNTTGQCISQPRSGDRRYPRARARGYRLFAHPAHAGAGCLRETIFHGLAPVAKVCRRYAAGLSPRLTVAVPTIFSHLLARGLHSIAATRLYRIPSASFESYRGQAPYRKRACVRLQLVCCLFGMDP